MEHQMSEEQNQLSPADKARLMLNLPSIANRFVEFDGKRFPVVHLGIGDLEQFRAAVAPIETLYLQFANSERSLIEFMQLHAKEIAEMFTKDVPKAASIVLGLPEGTLMAPCAPLSAFSVVLGQWLHNQEIGALQGLFPPPPDDDEERELEGDPSAMNPLGIVQKLASAYHWDQEQILKTTVPQVYLMGNDAAWSYARIKSDSPSSSTSKRKPIIVNGKKRSGFEGMTSAEYQQYLAGTALGGI
jgi:hypothetical protein